MTGPNAITVQRVEDAEWLPDCSGFQLAGYLAHLQEVAA